MQFTTAVVATANSDYLLANMFLGHPSVKDGTAEGLAQSICDEVQRHGIRPEQIEGFTPGGFNSLALFVNILTYYLSPDGQYIKWQIPSLLQDKLGLGPNFRASWDALHRYN